MENQYNIPPIGIFENIDIFTNSKSYFTYSTNTEVILFSKTTTESEDSLLSDILKATKIDSNIVSINKIPSNHQINLGNFFDSSSTKTCICFGLNASEIGIHFDLRLFQPMMLKSKKLLLSPKLDQLALNKNFKIELWKCLQTLFSI